MHRVNIHPHMKIIHGKKKQCVKLPEAQQLCGKGGFVFIERLRVRLKKGIGKRRLCHFHLFVEVFGRLRLVAIFFLHFAHHDDVALAF